MSIKTRKAIADAVEATGEVVAMVSPFGGPPDLQGDVIAESAYTQDIAYWNASKNRLPVLISHDWEEPTANIGHVERLEAVQGYGLVAHIKLDLLNERARYVHKLLAERRMVEFSIGYDVLPGGQEKQRDGSTLLTRLHLIEISIVLKGAAATAGARDARTELLSVKAAPAIPTATLTDDGRTRCSNCGKFAAIPQRPTTVFSGDRVFIDMCSGCGALQGYSPKSWPPGTRADALQEIRGRAVWNIITALRDNGAPTEVIKSAMTSARYCLDDPDGYTVAEFAGHRGLDDLGRCAVVTECRDDVPYGAPANLLQRVGSRTWWPRLRGISLEGTASAAHADEHAIAAEDGRGALRDRGELAAVRAPRATVIRQRRGRDRGRGLDGQQLRAGVACACRGGGTLKNDTDFD